MAKTYKKLMEEARHTIPEFTVDEVKNRVARGEQWTLLDVREREEYRDGHLEGALSLPRGFLELRVEDTVPDKSTPLIAYCVGGVRSLMAARTLKDMGYEKVVSLASGYTAWKNTGNRWVADRRFPPEQLTRYARHFTLPEVGENGQAKLLEGKILCIGAGGLGVLSR